MTQQSVKITPINGQSVQQQQPIVMQMPPQQLNPQMQQPVAMGVPMPAQQQQPIVMQMPPQKLNPQMQQPQQQQQSIASQMPPQQMNPQMMQNQGANQQMPPQQMKQQQSIASQMPPQQMNPQMMQIPPQQMMDPFQMKLNEIREKDQVIEQTNEQLKKFMFATAEMEIKLRVLREDKKRYDDAMMKHQDEIIFYTNQIYLFKQFLSQNFIPQ